MPHDVSLTGAAVPPSAQLGEGLTPVREGERLASLDVLRGFALFGILMMNIQVFAMPVGEFLVPAEAVNGPMSDTVTWLLTKWLFEYKFMSLFSLLFGAGFMVQLMRADARGAKHAPVYLRRLGVLALFGLLHGFVLWYGDILFVYALGGLALLLVGRLNPRLLLAIGAGIIFTMCTMYIATTTLVAIAGEQWTQRFEAPTDDASARGSSAPSADEDAFSAEAQAPVEIEPGEAQGPGDDAAPKRWYESMNEAGWNPSSDTWREAETIAYRDGPWSDALGFRAVSYGFSLAAAAFGYGWHALGMFFVGAGLLRLGFFQKSVAARRWQVRLATLGLLVGVPIEGMQAWLAFVGATGADESGIGMLLAAGLHEVGALSMTLGLAGCGCLVAHARVWRPVAAALANVGRMALTNYIMQTLVATFIMYHWGLGYFGSFSRVEQAGIVVAIFAGQLVLSALWLRAFRMGPLEWLWRALTYLRPPAMLRSSTSVT